MEWLEDSVVGMAGVSSRPMWGNEGGQSSGRARVVCYQARGDPCGGLLVILIDGRDQYGSFSGVGRERLVRCSEGVCGSLVAWGRW